MRRQRPDTVLYAGRAALLDDRLEFDTTDLADGWVS
jgi:hypothetical protein